MFFFTITSYSCSSTVQVTYIQGVMVKKDMVYNKTDIITFHRSNYVIFIVYIKHLLQREREQENASL